MKRLTYLFTACACALLCACESDKEQAATKTCYINNTQVSNLSSDAVEIAFTVAYESGAGYNDSNRPEIKMYGVYYSASSNRPTANDQSVVGTNPQYGQTLFTVSLKYFMANTHYYARAFIRDAIGTEIMGDVIEFTTLKNGSSSATLNDFLGTYKCRAQRLDGYETWDNVVVTSFYNEETKADWVEIFGFWDGYKCYTMMGPFDAANSMAHLYGSWYDVNYPCYFEETGDTAFYAVPFPVVVFSNGDWDYLEMKDINAIDGNGEVLLKRNADGSLYLTASDKPDKNNHYANAILYDYLIAETAEWSAYKSFAMWLDGATFTKVSSNHAPAHSPEQARSIINNIKKAHNHDTHHSKTTFDGHLLSR